MINQIMVILTNCIGVFAILIGLMFIVFSTEVKVLLTGAAFFIFGLMAVGAAYHHAPTLFILSRSV